MADDLAEIRLRLPPALLAKIDALDGNRSEIIERLLHESFKDWDRMKTIKQIAERMRL